MTDFRSKYQLTLSKYIAIILLFQLFSDQTTEYNEFKESSEKKLRETTEYYKNEILKERENIAKVC